MIFIIAKINPARHVGSIYLNLSFEIYHEIVTIIATLFFFQLLLLINFISKFVRTGAY